MTQAKQLQRGTDVPSPTRREEKQRIAILRKTVTKYLPEFARCVTDFASKGKDNVILIHQDAFAAGYDDDEYTLLGMAIKFAGLYGVSVTIHGKVHETF